jgi:glycosyltransferase involved in cell wall biosynthesis
MRIAIDANVLGGSWGGIPKYLDRIATELIADGDRVDLLANTRRLSRTVTGAHEVGVRVKGTPIWREAFLPAWLAAARPDVLWAPESLLPRLCPVPTVVTIHDLASLRFDSVKPKEHRRRFHEAVARSARRADRVIAVSQATAADIEEHYGIDAATVRVVPNGVDDAFSPAGRDASIAAVRERWGLEGDFVLHVGSLEPRKGLDVLIEAAALTRTEGGAWTVALAGSSGFEGERISQEARESGACALLGPVGDRELCELMRAAAAYASPALYEGFGIAPLEAMASGTPAVIAADSGGLEEVSGPAAIVVAERSAAAWRDALERAIARPGDLIERGLAHADRFRWPRVAAETRAVLAEAAEASGGG